MRYFHSLTFRVIVGSCLLLVALFGLYTYFAISFHNSQMMNQVRDSASILSDIIKNSTHYSMLTNRSEEVKEAIYGMSRVPGVEIRIYNKRGQIMVSTERAQEGRVVDMSAEACNVCHDSTKPLAKPLQSVPSNRLFRYYAGPRGDRFAGLINPIRNEPSC